MKTENIESLLQKQPFLEGLDAKSLALIAGCGRNVHFRPDSYICRQGGPADQFFLLRHGAVALEIFVPGQGPVVFQTLHESEMLGVSWLVPPYRWDFDARAMETVRGIAFNAECLRNKCDEDHDFGYEMMRRFVPVLVARLQAARLQSADIFAQQVG